MGLPICWRATMTIDFIDRLSGRDGECDLCKAHRMIFAVKLTDGSWRHCCSDCAKNAKDMP